MRFHITDQKIPLQYKISWMIFFLVFLIVLIFQWNGLRQKPSIENWKDIDFYEWKEMNGLFKKKSNRFTQRELENLPGIGPSWSNRIMSYKEKKGLFWEEDLKKVPSMNKTVFLKLKKIFFDE